MVTFIDFFWSDAAPFPGHRHSGLPRPTIREQTGVCEKQEKSRPSENAYREHAPSSVADISLGMRAKMLQATTQRNHTASGL